ncbi:ABC-type multidrug transport system, ATPase component [Rothia mucilaginosa DY-18]|uniref:ABC-type multidrug transport system, ATPase component n=1 Tax=Rothia mucilaginosa (strain DY-18) TaxID=680646 RepID=D2NTS8_ROTMD|nr:ABC-type multidrug transport system, ATPase component [Rothia mucilaginosa DY-18]
MWPWYTPSGNLARIPRFVILFSVLRGGVLDDDGVAVDVESLTVPVSHASLLGVLDSFEEKLVGVFNGQGCEGLLLTEPLVEGNDGCGGFDQVAVGTDVEFTLRTSDSVEAECGKECTRSNVLGFVGTEAQLTQGGEAQNPGTDDTAACDGTGFFERGRDATQAESGSGDAGVSLGGLYFLAACGNVLGAQLSFLVIDERVKFLSVKLYTGGYGINTGTATACLSVFSAGFLVCEDADDFTDEGAAQAHLVALASRVPRTEEERCGGGVEQCAHVCGGAVAQCAVLVVFGDGLTVDVTGTEVAIEDAVGEFHVGVFDGTVFGLVGDDGAGNLDDCFVAVLAALFDGGFCTVEFRLLAVNEDDLLRLALDGLLGFVLVFRLLYDVADFVCEDRLTVAPLTIDKLGGCQGCVGACCRFLFSDRGDNGAATELDVLDEVGEGDDGLGLVLGHGCLLR